MADKEYEAGDMDLRLETLKSFSGKIVQAVLGFAGTIVFARVLGPTSFGGFYFLLSIVLLADRPLRGLAQAVRKRYSETDTNKEEIVGGVLLANLAFFIVAGAAVWLLRRPLIDATGLHAAPVVFMALMVCLGFFFPFQRILGAQGWISKQTWNDTLRSVLTLGLQLGFVFAGFGAPGMGYGLAGASILVVPVALYYLRVRPVVPTRETLWSLWEYAKYSIPASFVGKAYDRFDVLLIGTALTTGAVGYYEVALKLTVPAVFLPKVISSGLMPKISNKHSRNESIVEDVTNATAYISLFSVPLFFGALALSERIVVTAYGSTYRPGGVLLIGLAFYQLIRSQTLVYRQTLAGLDRPDLNLKIDTATLALNIVVGVALVFIVGTVGVVAATVIAESVRYLLSAYAVSILTEGISYVPRPLIDQIVAALGMYLAVVGLDRVVALQSFPNVLGVVMTGGAVYGLLLVAVSPGFRLTIQEVLRDLVGPDRFRVITRIWRR